MGCDVSLPKEKQSMDKQKDMDLAIEHAVKTLEYKDKIQVFRFISKLQQKRLCKKKCYRKPGEKEIKEDVEIKKDTPKCVTQKVDMICEHMDVGCLDCRLSKPLENPRTKDEDNYDDSYPDESVTKGILDIELDGYMNNKDNVILQAFPEFNLPKDIVVPDKMVDKIMETMEWFQNYGKFRFSKYPYWLPYDIDSEHMVYGGMKHTIRLINVHPVSGGKHGYMEICTKSK